MYVYIYIYVYINVYMINDTQSAQISQKQDGRNIYAVMKTMWPPGYHHNCFVATLATRALGHVPINIYKIYIYIYIYIHYIYIIYIYIYI